MENKITLNTFENYICVRVYIYRSIYTSIDTHTHAHKQNDSGIVVSEFKLQLRYYVPFRANTLRKGMNHLILQAMG